MRDAENNENGGIIDWVIRAYHRVIGRPDRPTLPPPPDPRDYEVDSSPPTPEEQAVAEQAAKEVMRRLRPDSKA
jgi:hypothetical protein